MNRLCQLSRYLAVFVAGHFFIFPLRAENSPIAPERVTLFVTATNLLPPLPSTPQSPVEFFRNLLAMSPRDRNDFLTNRPPPVRERILAKVNEYLALDPGERELRLRATAAVPFAVGGAGVSGVITAPRDRITLKSPDGLVVGFCP